MKGTIILILSALALSESYKIICDEGSFIPHKDCSQFLQCIDGQLITLKCPKRLHFDILRGRCNSPSKAKCSQMEAYNNEIADLESLDASDPNLVQAICAKNSAHGKLVAHKDCKKFYMCSFGKPVTYTCPFSFVFSIDKQQCDWPDRVECENRNHMKNGDEWSDLDPKQICATYDSDGTLLPHEYCHQYYNCSDGIPISSSCPLGYLYNAFEKVCDKAENVVCGKRLRTITDNNSFKDTAAMSQAINSKRYLRELIEINGLDMDASQPYHMCAAENLDGLSIYHENCNQYYKCSQGILVAFDCPYDLLYNPIKEKCDLPENVNCENRHMPETYSSIPIQTYDTKRFITKPPHKTKNKKTTTKSSNIKLKKPGAYDYADKATDICSIKGSEGKLIAHSYCNHFYKCFQGQPFALKCPTTLLYNPKTRYCDWSTVVDCSDRLTSNYQRKNSEIETVLARDVLSDSVVVPGKTVNICASVDSEGKLSPHKYCNLFYKCYNSRPVTIMCPEKLLYDPSKLYCDWPLSVNCGERPIYEFKAEDYDNFSNEADGEDEDSGSGSENNSDYDYLVDNEEGTNDIGDIGEDYNKSSIINSQIKDPHEFCALNASDGEFTAHEICSKFYKCTKGVAIPYSCPNSLLYNINRKFCDWPRNVDCGKRSLGINTSISLKSNNNNLKDICNDSSLGGKLMPHRKCNKFYKCIDGELVDSKCPKGLVFNTEDEVCDWPKNVSCGRRIRRSKSREKDKEITGD